MTVTFPLSYETTVFALCMLLCIALVAVAVKRRLGWACGAAMAVLSCVLCMVCARGYYLLVAGAGFQFRLFPPQPYDYAFAGGVLGFLAALWLTARLLRKPFSLVADAFTPVGLLGIVALRMAEALSDFGWGDMVEAAWLQRYPFAVENMYGEWCAAVFHLEALAAAIILLVLLLAGERLRGRRMQTALVWWAVTQVFCESLRVECITWGFIRVQQLFSAGVLLVLLVLAMVRMPRSRRKQMLPTWGCYLLCCGMVIFLEFAIDKMPWPTWVNYGVMALVLLVLGACVQRHIHPVPLQKEQPL